MEESAKGEWRDRDLCSNLREEWKEPKILRMRHLDTVLSVKAVKAVADVVSLGRSLEELKDFISPKKLAPQEAVY